LRICVCGAQSPFTRGGAELLQENLVRALVDAGHEVDLVRLPVTWSRERVLESAFAWRLLNLDADLVVATNFPSYFVVHPRKVVWLLHQHRAAYDALGAAWSDFGLTDDALEAHRLVAEWDCRVLSEAATLFTISNRVGERLRRYNGLESETLYHPPPLHERLHGGQPGDYLFSATRLEANKRPDLMIRALAHSRGRLRLLIAGEGSMRRQLEGLIREHGLSQRVTLLGWVDDDELVRLFAGCRAALYVPFDEDYGYVTLQAFRAGKPVIRARLWRWGATLPAVWPD
jgi:glycosyltransferase involved in cell wall biosynthesis